MTTSAIATPRPAIGLTVLRVVTGLIFLAHGAQKLFIYGIPGVTGGFAGMGIPLAGLTAPLVVALELLGGLALILGLGTRVAAALLALDMLGAIAFVHLKGGFFLPSGIEFALALLGANVALALAGPGAAAADDRLARRRA